MDKAPERIWAAPDTDDGWRWPVASKFPMQGYAPDGQIEYIRALPTPDHAALLAAALKLPEVAAMRAAANRAIESAVADSMDEWFEDLRATLAALGVKL